MKKLIFLAGILVIFTGTAYAKEKETFIALGGSLKCLHTDGVVRDGACKCMPDSPGSCANVAAPVNPGPGAELPATKTRSPQTSPPGNQPQR